MKVLNNCFEQIVAPENLWAAWLKYRKGKHKKAAAREFEANLESNLIGLRNDLLAEIYKHDGYYQFVVRDPKQRTISVPSVRDHLVHQAIFNVLYPFFDLTFLPFSFSCRDNKGTLKAINLFSKYLGRVSKNYRQDCWVLHGDVKKCFDSIKHDTLISLLKQRIKCPRTIKLLENIVGSYSVSDGRGIPLGNLTSQLFINVYLHELDIFVKEKMGVKKYLRYADDFLLVFDDQQLANDAAEQIRNFLKFELSLDFPLDHQKIRSLSGGIEVLGRRFLPLFNFIRPKTFRRLCGKLQSRVDSYDLATNGFIINSAWQSAVGLLKYGNNQNKRRELFEDLKKNIYVQR